MPKKIINSVIAIAKDNYPTGSTLAAGYSPIDMTGPVSGFFREPTCGSVDANIFIKITNNAVISETVTVSIVDNNTLIDDSPYILAQLVITGEVGVFHSLNGARITLKNGLANLAVKVHEDHDNVMGAIFQIRAEVHATTAQFFEPGDC